MTKRKAEPKRFAWWAAWYGLAISGVLMLAGTVWLNTPRHAVEETDGNGYTEA